MNPNNKQQLLVKRKGFDKLLLDIRAIFRNQVGVVHALIASVVNNVYCNHYSFVHFVRVVWFHSRGTEFTLLSLPYLAFVQSLVVRDPPQWQLPIVHYHPSSLTSSHLAF